MSSLVIAKSFTCHLKKRSREKMFGYACFPSINVVITHIFKGIPAQRSGLRPGQRIIEVNGVAVRDYEHYDSLMKGSPDSKSVTLTVIDLRAKQFYPDQFKLTLFQLTGEKHPSD